MMGQAVHTNQFSFFCGVDGISAALLQRCCWVSASSSKLSTRFSRSIAKTGLFVGSNGGLKMRSKKASKKWFQRVPKWTPKVGKNRQKGCSGGVPKRNLKKVPSPGPGKVRFCCYLLHFSKVGGLKRACFLGTVLEHLGDKIVEIGVKMSGQKSSENRHPN